MFCPNCGSKNLETDKYCKNCGFKINDKKGFNLKLLIPLGIILLLLLSGFFLLSSNNDSNNTTFSNSSSNISKEKSLGKNNLGEAYFIGKYGNINSDEKIAIITGVHPLESNAHNTMINTIKSKDKSLNKCYYIYGINVTKDPLDYSKGRMNGQLIAREFLVPEISKGDFDLVLDIHSNTGNGDYMEHRFFIFTPLNNDESLKISNTLVNKTNDLEYYSPKSQTSPDFVTIPIIKNGKPAIIYEVYQYTAQEKHDKYATDFLNVLDNMEFV